MNRLKKLIVAMMKGTAEAGMGGLLLMRERWRRRAPDALIEIKRQKMRCRLPAPWLRARVTA